jgi:hypothetical protein
MKKRQLCMWQNDVYLGVVFEHLPRAVRPAVSGKGLVRMEACWNARMTERQRDQWCGLELDRLQLSHADRLRFMQEGRKVRTRQGEEAVQGRGRLRSLG